MTNYGGGARRRVVNPLAQYSTKSEIFNFSGGIIGQISDRMKRPNWLKYANNVIFRPLGGISSRPGSRNLTTWAGPGSAYRCNTLAKWYDPAGSASKLMGFYSDGANNKMYLVDGTSGTLQSLPTSPTSEIYQNANINGLLVMAQRGGTDKPIFYNGTVWLSSVSPKPGVAPTTALVAGGAVDAGNHYYRMRWVYKNASSLAGPASAAVTPAAGNLTVRCTVIHPGVPRADYIGCRIERTKLGATAAGRWYVVADVPAATASFDDLLPDAALNVEADDGIHAEPSHFDGVLGWNNRLIGWDARAIYVSQVVGDAEETGIFNFDGDLIYPAYTDDGDPIQCCVKSQDTVFVIKTHSMFILEGDNPNNFFLRPFLDGTGAIGPRAAAALGGAIYFQSRRGWERLTKSGLDTRFSYSRMGHYFETVNLAAASRAVVRVVENEYVIFAFPAAASTVNNEIAVYDLRMNNWTHWTQWAGRDFLVQKDAAFSNATLLFADESSKNVYAALDGLLDARAADNSSGTAIPVYIETPPIDDFTPDMEKEYQRVEFQHRLGAGTLGITISCDSGKRSGSVSLSLLRNNSRWGAAATANKTLRWGPLSAGSIAAGYSDKWGASGYANPFSGLPEGTWGRDYVLKATANLTSAFEARGFVIDMVLRPNRGYS